MADQIKLRKRLEALLKKPENQVCCDCGRRGARWASANLGNFFCIECSGIHRNLGVHISFVRSVNLDTWTVKQVEFMEEWGNSRCNAYYEAKLPSPNMKAKETDSVRVVERYIRDKYQHKKFIADNIPPKMSTSVTDESDANAANRRAIAERRGSTNKAVQEKTSLSVQQQPKPAIAPKKEEPSLINFLDDEPTSIPQSNQQMNRNEPVQSQQQQESVFGFGNDPFQQQPPQQQQPQQQQGFSDPFFGGGDGGGMQTMMPEAQQKPPTDSILSLFDNANSGQNHQASMGGGGMSGNQIHHMSGHPHMMMQQQPRMVPNRMMPNQMMPNQMMSNQMMSNHMSGQMMYQGGFPQQQMHAQHGFSPMNNQPQQIMMQQRRGSGSGMMPHGQMMGHMSQGQMQHGGMQQSGMQQGGMQQGGMQRMMPQGMGQSLPMNMQQQFQTQQRPGGW